MGAMLVRLHHRFDPERFIGAGPETELAYGEFLASQIADPNVIVLVAEEEGQVVGYAYGAIEGNDWTALRGPAGVLYDLAVDEQRRREGIGRYLLQAALSALIELGAPQIVLASAEQNVAAQSLFAASGFRPTMLEMTWDPPNSLAPAPAPILGRGETS